MSLLLLLNGNNGGAAAPTYATWNPLDTAYSLSAGNRFAGPGHDWVITRATAYKNSGKHSFEVEANGMYPSFGDTMIYGIAKASAGNYYLGSDNDGVGLYLNNGCKVFGGSMGAFASFTPLPGDIFTFHYDAGDGSLIVERNGVELGTMATPFAGVLVTPACSLYGAATGCTLKNGPVQYPRAGYAQGWVV